MEEVTLSQMLQAREHRAFRQLQLSRELGLPLVSFSMNIPGPVKNSPLIRRGFRAGQEALEKVLPRKAIRHRELTDRVTGCEAMFAVDMDPLALKALTTEIEDTHGLGRLFDMDVLDPGLSKLDRQAVGGGSRNCLVCGAPGRVCASRRLHDVPQLQAAVRGILTGYFREKDREFLARTAAQSLLREVRTTPKPGLVDEANTGSHSDMDLALFTASAEALVPYFSQCVRIGMDTAKLPPEETFPALRAAGLEAERAMYAVTGGVNTHKGAIFTMGILCGAAGRLWTPEGHFDPQALCREAGAMTKAAMARDFAALSADTAGGQLYRELGIQGIRGEAARGFPAVSETGLPVFRALRAQGLCRNDAGAVTLLHLIARVEDTCLYHRGGAAGARAARERAAALLPCPTLSQIGELDRWFVSRRLSPGGSADLLAAVYFLDAISDPEA